MKSDKLFSNIEFLSDFNYSKTFLNNNKIMLKWKFMNAILIIVIIIVILFK